MIPQVQALYPSTLQSHASPQDTPGRQEFIRNQLPAPDIKAQIKYLSNADVTERAKLPIESERFQKDEKSVFMMYRSVDSPKTNTRIKSQKHGSSVFAVNSHVLQSCDSQLDKLQEAVKVSRLETKAVGNTINSMKFSLNTPQAVPSHHRRKSSLYGGASTQMASARKGSHCSDPSSAIVRKNKNEYLSKIEIKSRQKQEEVESVFDQPYQTKPSQYRTFYSNPITHQNTMLREYSPSHYVMNLTTYTWKDIEDYIKNPRNNPPRPQTGVRHKLSKQRRKKVEQLVAPQFSLQGNSHMEISGLNRPESSQQQRNKNYMRHSGGFRGGIYTGSVTPSSIYRNIIARKSNKSKQKGGNILMAKVIGSPISLQNREDPFKGPYFENRMPSREENYVRRVSQSSIPRKPKQSKRKFKRPKQQIPIDSIERWENEESQIQREPSLQRFIEKRKINQKIDTHSDSQSSAGGDEDSGLDPKLKEGESNFAKKLKQSIEGTRLGKKRSMKLKRAIKSKKRSEVKEEEESGSQLD